MVRYLFYTIGDLTYQSPLVIILKIFWNKKEKTQKVTRVREIVLVKIPVLAGKSVS